MRNSVSKLWGFAMRCQSVFVASLKQHVINYHEIVFYLMTRFWLQYVLPLIQLTYTLSIGGLDGCYGHDFCGPCWPGGDYYKYCCTMTMLHYFQSRVFVAAPSIPRGFMRIPPVVSDDALGVESTSCRARWLAIRGWCKGLQTRTGWSSF
jgi:hypothetical protein